jgi:hypothetical protein
MIRIPGRTRSSSSAKYGYEVWQLQGADPEAPYVLPILFTGGANAGNISQQSAYWVDRSTIAWAGASEASNVYRLYYAPEGGLSATSSGITGGEYITLLRDPDWTAGCGKGEIPPSGSTASLEDPASRPGYGGRNSEELRLLSRH